MLPASDTSMRLRSKRGAKSLSAWAVTNVGNRIDTIKFGARPIRNVRGAGSASTGAERKHAIARTPNSDNADQVPVRVQRPYLPDRINRPRGILAPVLTTS
jgi:hypothetical protein